MSVFNPGILIIGAVIGSVEVVLMIVCVYRLFRFLYREVSLKIEKLCRETIKLSRYVNAIDYSMGEFAKGNLTARSSVTFIGDFASIQKSIVVFAEKVRDVIGSVEESSQIVAESSEQIDGQTNLLALNASIEAARAGSMGAVFAGTRTETEAIARIREGVNDISNMVLTSSAASQANKRYGFFPIFGFCHLL